MKNKNLSLEKLELQTISLEDHPMKWLFELKEGVPPSEEHKSQIFPLTKEAAKFISEYEGKVGIGAFSPKISNFFKEVKRFEFEENKEHELKKWLYHLGIPFQNKVFVSFDHGDGFILTWKMIIKYSSNLFFGCDVEIWDKTSNWFLWYSHNDVFLFGKTRIYSADTEAEKKLGAKALLAEWEKRSQLNFKKT